MFEIIHFQIPVSASGTTTLKIPVPYVGRVREVRLASNDVIASGGAETIDFRRDTTSVNLVTTAATYVAGTVITGVPDTTNAGLEFDPESSTEANKCITVLASQMAAAGEVCGWIKFDRSSHSDMEEP